MRWAVRCIQTARTTTIGVRRGPRPSCRSLRVDVTSCVSSSRSVRRLAGFILTDQHSIVASADIGQVGTVELCLDSLHSDQHRKIAPRKLLQQKMHFKASPENPHH